MPFCRYAMNINLSDAVALISVVIAVLSFVIGLPVTIYSAKKQVAEAKNLLAQEAATYSKAAKDAVESQASLQNQINELRADLKSRDELIEQLQKEIGKRDSKILDQDQKIQEQAKEIAELRSEVESLRKLQ